jgi:aminodeoxyfutalosine synthase
MDPRTLINDNQLEPVAETVLAGGRLDRKQALIVATSVDLLGVGALANVVRERLHGDTTYFNINRHLNPTNVCSASCALCAFAVPISRKDDGWAWSVEEAMTHASEGIDRSVSEVHIVGGLNPSMTLSYYEHLFRELKRRFPWIHIKALTMVELDFIATVDKLPLEEVIGRLRAAGLDSCPGGGAEIFSARARRRICNHKTDGTRWLEVARTVHRMGLPSNCTMLYGHVETPEERVDHLLALRKLQDDTNGFQCFIPLAFHPQNTRLADLPPTSGRLDLQTMALARLVLDNISHIKAYWIMLGEKIAQVAQHFGADDLDGTVVDERITWAAGGTAGKGLSRSRLEALIREAGRVPTLRDTLYRTLEGDPSEAGASAPLASPTIAISRGASTERSQ